MKTPRKPRPVFIGGVTPTPHKVISATKDPEAFAQGMKNLVADLAPAGVGARIRANLQHIQRDAENILSAKGIDGPRFVTVGTATPGRVTAKENQIAERFRAKGCTVAFDWQVDEQAKVASKAYTTAMIAINHLARNDFLRTADCALIAATELRKAIALPFVTSTQASRRRRHETPKRFRVVSDAGRNFMARHNRWPKMGRTADREWMNSELQRLGVLPFRSYAAFRVWKTQHGITLPW